MRQTSSEREPASATARRVEALDAAPLALDALDAPPARLRDFSADRRLLGIAALALVVGALCAAIAVALMTLIGLVTNLVYNHRVSTTLISPAANLLGWWSAPIPIVGGLIVGLMARFGSERIRGHGIPEAMETILIGGSKIEPKLAILKPISSAIAIGTGGPFGAEGPIILTGGAFGSLLAQFFHLTAAERKTLLVAGAAAGMAATFNAPIASVLLAVELLLFEWKPRSLIPVALAAATATALRRLWIGGDLLFPLGTHPALDLAALPAALVVGVAAGVVAWLLTLGVYGAEDAFRRLPIHWLWWPALGGVVVGVGGVFFPRALGVGYDTIAAEIHGSLPVDILLGVILAKSILWIVALGSGTSGGVLAPLLLIGGALGGIAGGALPGHTPGVWALLAMAATLTGAIGSPLTSVIFAVEVSGAYDLLLPLLVACMAAHAFATLTLRRSILTEKVARRGYHIAREYGVDPLEALTVGEVMRPDAVGVSPLLALASAEAQQAAQAQRLLPVVDEQSRLLGVVSYADSVAALARDDAALAQDALRAPVVAYPDETLRAVAARMLTARVWRLPVVTRAEPHRLVGLVAQRDLLRARERLLVEERRRERVLRVRTLLPRRPTPRGEASQLAAHAFESTDSSAEPEGPSRSR